MSGVEDCCSVRYVIQQLPRKERDATKLPYGAPPEGGPRGAARRSAKFKVTTAFIALHTVTMTGNDLAECCLFLH